MGATATTTPPPRAYATTPKGQQIVTNGALALQRTSPKAGDFTGLRGASVAEVVARIPSDWVFGDSETGGGVVWRAPGKDGAYDWVRVHDASPSAPAGSNSAAGRVLRVFVGGSYRDENGAMTTRSSNDGHVPLFGDPNA